MMGGLSARLRGFVTVICALIGLVAFAAPGTSQSFPSRPITLVVPFAAGGPTDTLARILAERMAADLRATIVVENVVGASGSIAGARVARATPDGTTITIGHWGTHVLNGAIYKLSYDVLADFEPIALVASGPQLIVGRKTLEAGNLKELIAWLKDNPNKASAGTAGAGSGAHVAGVFFKTRTGTEFQFVPYRGAGPAMIDLVAGQIDLMFDQASNSLPQIKNGTIKAFAVTSPTRLAAAPDIPTVDEAGLPGLYISYWHGIMGAEEHAQGRPRAAQRGNRGRARRSKGPSALCGARSGNPATRAAGSGRTRSVPERRDRQVVAYREDRRHKGGIGRGINFLAGLMQPASFFITRASLRCEITIGS